MLSTQLRIRSSISNGDFCASARVSGSSDCCYSDNEIGGGDKVLEKMDELRVKWGENTG